ncbi:hypothetical protein RE428_32200 [Marinobacter nanhaiticus D15-8W]|uniref:XRE family transcriptional regulator n=1 Tax=Marinobacter nanhaiticus D15-8W TaxID=626887 RepID=N6X0D9_9GAMM|nr:helix-turn-helix transcriptional regulator [Marinobacter nanhaiticus]ENO16912.1 XRE family transcriptional regulator [Marinobacter nanhaiticus D15-8W]BES72202.1 hypothetical protein RE428_32200 [Marinobacter nanhaiticus D15-8W]
MNVPVEEVVGDNVRRARMGKGWSQRKLAEVADVSQRVISNIEQGGGAGSSAIKYVDMVAQGLGAPTFMLFRKDMPLDATVVQRTLTVLKQFEKLSERNQLKVLDIMADYGQLSENQNL